MAPLLDPRPDVDVKTLNADLAEYLRDLSETHATALQRDRHFVEMAIRPFPLGQLDLIQHFCQFGKVRVHQLH